MNLSAINSEFLTRFVFVVIAYWVIGIFTKGIFEPIQAKLGRELYGRFHRKTEELDRRAVITRNQIDDFIIGRLRDGSASLQAILNPSDLSESDRRYLQEKVNETYSVSVLTKKALEKFPTSF